MRPGAYIRTKREGVEMNSKDLLGGGGAWHLAVSVVAHATLDPGVVGLSPTFLHPNVGCRDDLKKNKITDLGMHKTLVCTFIYK